MTATEPEGPSIDIAAKFALTLDAVSGLSSRMARVAKRLEMQPMTPVARSYPVSTIIPAGGFAVAIIQGPDQGHYWYVRSIVVGGATPATAVAGRADVFVSAADLRQSPSVAAIGLNNWRDQAATMPLVAFYGTGEMRLVAGEDLFIVFSGATPAQQYNALAYIEDVQDAPVKQEFGV